MLIVKLSDVLWSKFCAPAAVLSKMALLNMTKHDYGSVGVYDILLGFLDTENFVISSTDFIKFEDFLVTVS